MFHRTDRNPYPHRNPNTHRNCPSVDCISDVLSRFSRQIEKKQLTVEVDAENVGYDLHSPSWLYAAVESLVEHAVGRSPQGGELSITLLKSKRGVEIEVADSGSSENPRVSAAFAPSSVHYDQSMSGLEWSAGFAEVAADRLNSVGRSGLPSQGRLFCARCPQGGLAWTLVVPDRLAALKVA